MAEEENIPTPVEGEAAPEKKRRGRKKAEAPVEPWPRAGEVPTAEEIRNAADARALEEAEKAKDAKKTPWPGFNAPPVNSATDHAAIKSRVDALNDRRLTLLPGCKYYKAKRNCRNGRYRQGRIYALPEPQPAELFDLV